MNEFENNKNDNLSGFDSANGTNETVDSFYSKKADDIIQDEQPINNTTPPPSYVTPIYTPNYNNVYQKPIKPKKTHSTGVVIIACVLAAIIGAVSSIVALVGVYDIDANTTIVTEQETSDNKSNININVNESASSIAEAVAKKCSDSVVGIRTTTSVMSFFGGSQNTSGEGSGVVYTADGYIITNYHVIAEAVESQNSKIDVFIKDNKSTSYPATVIGYNISCDLAVIKINATDLTPVTLGNSDKLNVGQYVITIGAPGGLEFMGSVTYGIISGLGRTVSTDSQLKLIQTDAAINPGNSGGALLNAKGELIGINSSKIVAAEFEGMGFAIPSNAVKEKCDKIISRNNDTQAYLGVTISKTYTAQVLAFYGYPSGAVVSTVSEDSPAAKAGIERGDIITEFNNTKISEYTVLNDLLYDCEPNQTVPITIYRNGQEYSIEITLGADGS